MFSIYMEWSPVSFIHKTALWLFFYFLTIRQSDHEYFGSSMYNKIA
ncbi:hypothetical protein CHCC14821_0126 [Bacillus paralicheniformis]|nr:hypothetical protein CHCC14821_0126 [Bacillus paralicheniformis]